ncbi:MAG: hypothetical protein AAGG51_19425 [Cyanobacteria bacterium P01_G01_bin.54]
MTSRFSLGRLTAGLISFGLLCGCSTSAPNVTPVKAQPQTELITRFSPSQVRADIEIDPDFQKVAGKNVSLYLPKGYEGGDPQQDIEAVAQQLDAAGEEHKDLSEALRESQQRVMLIAFDSEGDEAGFVTNVNVSLQAAVPGTPLAVFMETMRLNLESQGYAIADTTLSSINGQSVGRLIADVTVGKVELSQLVYVFKNEDGFWLVTYSTAAEEFVERLPEFEQSVITFNPATTAAQR